MLKFWKIVEKIWQFGKKQMEKGVVTIVAWIYFLEVMLFSQFNKILFIFLHISSWHLDKDSSPSSEIKHFFRHIDIFSSKSMHFLLFDILAKLIRMVFALLEFLERCKVKGLSWTGVWGNRIPIIRVVYIGWNLKK